MTERPSRGRRPAGSGTREAIVAAARHQFGEQGYQKVSMRGIAAEAGVDPRLVVHFFGTKQKLFLSVVDLPFQPDLIFPELIGDGGPGVGRRLAEFLLTMLDTPDTRRVVTGIIRAAASEEEAARLWRDVVSQRLLLPLAAQVARDRAEVRAALVASQIVGLTMARHVVAVAPLADAEPALLISALAPVFEHYLTGNWAAEPVP